jgi:hypothetical protein
MLLETDTTIPLYGLFACSGNMTRNRRAVYDLEVCATDAEVMRGFDVRALIAGVAVCKCEKDARKV